MVDTFAANDQLVNNEILADVAMNFLKEDLTDKTVDVQTLQRIRQLFRKYIGGEAESSEIRSLLTEKVNTTRSFDLLHEVLTLPDTPPDVSDEEDVEIDGEQKKKRFWSINEDLRLIAAVHRLGMAYWDSISSFVGYRRTRLQCLQRWKRVLDPRLTKRPWTEEEEQKLISLAESDEKLSWGQIAARIGTKCDLQCRYKYARLSSARKQQAEEPSTETPEAAAVPARPDDVVEFTEDVAWMDIDLDLWC